MFEKKRKLVYLCTCLCMLYSYNGSRERSRKETLYTINRDLEIGYKNCFYVLMKLFMKSGLMLCIICNNMFYFCFINKIHYSFSSLLFFILGYSVSTCLWYFWSASSTGLDSITLCSRTDMLCPLFYKKLSFKREGIL